MKLSRYSRRNDMTLRDEKSVTYSVHRATYWFPRAYRERRDWLRIVAFFHCLTILNRVSRSSCPYFAWNDDHCIVWIWFPPIVRYLNFKGISKNLTFLSFALDYILLYSCFILHIIWWSLSRYSKERISLLSSHAYIYTSLSLSLCFRNIVH